MITNNLNLPAPLVRAVMNDTYTRGKSDISVTGMISPPFQRRLAETVERQEDVSQRIWSLIGQIGHSIVERAGKAEDSLAEERLFMDVNGWTVSGQFDLIECRVLMDFKFTSVWSFINGGKLEWEQQLNLLRVLTDKRADETGDDRYRVEKLQIVAIFRDWVQSKAGFDGYPPAQVAVIDIPMWPKEQAEAYLLERVKAHQDEDPPPCSDEERWAVPAVYALMKKDRKSAVRLYKSVEEAEEALNGKKDHWVELRPAQYRRCEGYCAVSHACPVYQSNPDGPF